MNKKREEHNNTFTYFRYWENWLTQAVFNMLKCEGFDDEKQEVAFKQNLLLGGRVCFFEHNGKMYNLDFSDAGKIGVYNNQIYNVRVVNPILTNLPVFVDGDTCKCVYLTENDRLREDFGLSDLIIKTAKQLADNDISIECLQFVKRMPSLFVAKNDNAYKGITVILDKIRKGVTNLVVKTSLNEFVERVDTTNHNTPLNEFTEYQQYIIGTFYNCIGVNANWNTKRERVSATETNVNSETADYNLLHICDYVSKQLDKVNGMFGTNYKISVNVSRETTETDETDSENNESEDNEE